MSKQVNYPKTRYRLQVHYKDDMRDDVVFFLNKPKPKSVEVKGSLELLVFKNDNEVFTCFNGEVFSFSITEEYI